MMAQSKLTILLAAGLIWMATAAAALGDEPPPQDKASPAAESVDDEAFDSQVWVTTKFGLAEWFGLQTNYDSVQVKRIEKDLRKRLKKMSPDEREAFHRELDLKLSLVLGREERDLLAWVAANYAAAAPAYRKKLDLQTPGILTLSPAQIREQLERLQRKRTAASNQAAALEQARQARIAALQAEQRQQYEQRERALDRGVANHGSGGYYSPYHPSGMRKYPEVVSRSPIILGFGIW